MKMELMADLYQRTLVQLLDGEKQMVQVLPKVGKALSDPELAGLFERHTDETRKQTQRLEQILEGKPRRSGVKAHGVAGLLSELKSVLEEGSDDPEILDAAL